MQNPSQWGIVLYPSLSHNESTEIERKGIMRKGTTADVIRASGATNLGNLGVALLAAAKKGK
jgi:hypothetical protein